MNAYSELYIDDARGNLAEFLDYMTIELGYEIDKAFELLSYSNIGKSFALGDPTFVTGCSGVELAIKLIYELTGKWIDKDTMQDFDRSPAYWAGYVLAEYQWEKNVSFAYLYERGIRPSILVDCYVLHEADYTKSRDFLDAIFVESHKKDNPLRRYRKYYSMTQKALSEKSGVSLRMIQLYEQGQNDISHAQFEIVNNLSKALGCHPEDLVT